MRLIATRYKYKFWPKDNSFSWIKNKTAFSKSNPERIKTFN